MSEQVYFSDIRRNYSVYAKLNAWINMDELGVAVKARDPIVEKIVSAGKMYIRGEKLNDCQIPPYFFADRHKSIKKLPAAFYANGFIVLQENCADIFRQFDLGETTFVETKILQNDKKTPVAGKYFVINFGSHKDTLLKDQSIGFRSVAKPSTEVGFKNMDWLLDSKFPNENRYQPPAKRIDDGLKLDRSSLQGVDLWHEARLVDLIFFSSRLHDALKAAKMSAPFQFFHCSIGEK